MCKGDMELTAQSLSNPGYISRKKDHLEVEEQESIEDECCCCGDNTESFVGHLYERNNFELIIILLCQNNLEK